jgi:hypothetical protein
VKTRVDIKNILSFLFELVLRVFIPPTIMYGLWNFALVGYMSVPFLGYWQVFAIIFIIRTVALVVAQEFRGQFR